MFFLFFLKCNWRLSRWSSRQAEDMLSSFRRFVNGFGCLRSCRCFISSAVTVGISIWRERQSFSCLLCFCHECRHHWTQQWHNHISIRRLLMSQPSSLLHIASYVYACVASEDQVFTKKRARKEFWQCACCARTCVHGCAASGQRRKELGCRPHVFVTSMTSRYSPS